MLRHHVLIIFRSFKRFKTSFIINLVGLSTGLACTLLAYLWVNDELKVDKFHANDSRLYKLMEHQKNSATSIRVTYSTPGLLAETLQSEQPEVEYASVVTPSNWFDNTTLTVGDRSIAAGMIYASKDFFKMFSFDLISGNASQVLADKSAIVISESTARALFQSPENAIGKAVDFQHMKEFIVSGVFEDVPRRSSQQFDFVLSFENFKDVNPNVVKWENSGPMTFVVLKESATAAGFEKKISGLISRHVAEKHRTLIMRKYSDVYLRGNYNDLGVETGGRIEYVIMFSVIAVFILLIACINFMNLSTAKASRKVKEVGIKKAIGASRNTLVLQYIGESMLMSFVALAIAVLLVDLLLPQFNMITGKHLALDEEPEVFLMFVVIAFFTGLISGSYPALYLSGFNPAVVLKGKLNSSLGELWARKGLVIFQFALSVIFIVAVVVVFRQIQYLQNKNLGYDRENLMYFPIQGKAETSLDAFLTELRSLPGVIGASSISESVVGGGNTVSPEWEGKDPGDRTPFAIRPVNFGMVELLGVTLVEGRLFSREHNDSLNVILNETAVRAMGFKDPLGKQINFGPIKSTVVGVIKDFHYESLHVPVNPMFFIAAPQYTRKVMVKLVSGNPTETIKGIQKFVEKFNPGFTFDYRFVDQDYQSQYDNELRVSLLSRYFAGLAILISCLGLFGLASFTAERRQKEIGIRKALGSTDLGIVYLLSSDFTKIVGLAILISLPVSYLLVKQWLDNFQYKIPLEWWYFVGSGLLALVIAWITVASQASRASRVNPVDCLKTE